MYYYEKLECNDKQNLPFDYNQDSFVAMYSLS